MTRIEDLREELERIGARIEEAAVVGDRETFVDLAMRRATIPRLIRTEQTRPLRREIERMQGELGALDAERERVRGLPAEVPQHLRGSVSPEEFRE